MMELRAGPRENPWPHLFFFQVFKKKFYPQLNEFMPAIKDMGQLRGGTYPNRYIYPLKDSKVLFWQEVNAAVTHKNFQKPLFELLGITQPAWPKAALTRDLPGYQIAPHPDANFKVATVLFYLPADHTQCKLGTLLIGPEKIKQVGFFPNTGLAFKTTKKSIHEVKTVPEGPPRNCLQICFFDTPERTW
jgi:hypothetical protein